MSFCLGIYKLLGKESQKRVGFYRLFGDNLLALLNIQSLVGLALEQSSL